MITLVKFKQVKNMVINTQEKMRARKAELEAEEQAEQAKLEEAKRNRSFVQVYRENMPELRWLMAKSGIASSLLFFIMEHMDNKNALACSYAVFQDYFKVSKPTITRAISLLKDNGFIDILKMGTSNVYIINYKIAWSSWANQKQFAKLDGTILVSKKENKDYEYRSQFDKFKALRQRENIKY